MKRTKQILSVLTVIAFSATLALASNSPYDTFITTVNSTADGTYTNVLPEPATPASFIYNPSTHTPEYGTLGTGLSYDHSTQILSVSGVAESSVTNLTSDLAAKFNTPTGSVSQLLRGDGSAATPSDSYSARSVNTCFQVSSTRNALVNYSVDIGTTLSLTSGQSGTVFLKTFTNSGCSTGTQEISRATSANNGTLAIGLGLNTNMTGQVSGFIPAGKWVELVTQNNTGTPTFTFQSGQEVQL